MTIRRTAATALRPVRGAIALAPCWAKNANRIRPNPISTGRFALGSFFATSVDRQHLNPVVGQDKCKRGHAYGHIITITAGGETHASRVDDCGRYRIVCGTDGVALRTFISMGEGGSRGLCVCCSRLGSVRVTESAVVRTPRQSPQRNRLPRSGCNRGPSWAGSLTLGRSPRSLHDKFKR